jgi:hypothetical protein
MQAREGGVMTATLTASGRDLRTLAGIVSEDRGEPPAYGLALSLLGDLLGLIRCDFLSFVGMDTAQQANLFVQGAPLEPGDDREETEEDRAPFWQHYWDSPCCSYPDRTADLRSITKISDFHSARQWHNTGMHSDYLRIEHEIMVCLPAGPGGPPIPAGGPAGRAFGCCSSASPARISPSGTARYLPCCVPTCTRPTSTRSAAAGAHRS